MKKIILNNTSIGSRNMGDYIIMQSVKRELRPILSSSLVLELPTHTPPIRYSAYRKMPFYKNTKSREIQTYEYGFVCGTNLLEKNMLRRQSQWNIKLREAKYIKNNIFVGVGAGTIGEINIYTKILLNKALSHEYIHSVRDEEAKKMLEEIGFRGINTGCATLWMLTNEHCKKIPITKAKNAVFTLTDYKKDIEKDQKLINILRKNYAKLYYWVQGSEDMEYIESLTDMKDINIIYPSLENYEDFLKTNECDFIGTRLHAGIKAMQEFHRSIIIIVDNRARSIKRDNNIVAIERDDIESELEAKINSSFSTKINLDQDAIETWKKQFN